MTECLLDMMYHNDRDERVLKTVTIIKVSKVSHIPPETTNNIPDGDESKWLVNNDHVFSHWS